MHRDLKPENLLISSDGILKITDFGTTRFKQPDSEVANYTTFICTTSYAPPEQHLDIANYDETFDMWSVGCIMSELWLNHPLIEVMWLNLFC